MKNFHKYKLSKNDNQIIKNFNLDTKYRVLSTEEMNIYWLKILKSTNEKILKNFYKPLLYMQCYISIINGKEYFFFDFNEKNFYNIFFINISDANEYNITNINKLSNSGEDIEIFKVICSIFIEERKKKRTLSYKIMLPNKYVKLYFKLIDKVNRQIYKNTLLNIKKIKNNYFYYYKGNMDLWHNLRFLLTYSIHKKDPFIDISSYIQF